MVGAARGLEQISQDKTHSIWGGDSGEEKMLAFRVPESLEGSVPTLFPHLPGQAAMVLPI